MAKQDLVDVMQKKGGFVQIYHPEKEKKNIPESCSPWGQSVELFFKDFKGLEDIKVSDTVTIVGKGSITRIDEKGVSLRIEQVKLEE